jgi:hypothetical protein
MQASFSIIAIDRDASSDDNQNGGNDENPNDPTAQRNNHSGFHD